MEPLASFMSGSVFWAGRPWIFWFQGGDDEELEFVFQPLLGKTIPNDQCFWRGKALNFKPPTSVNNIYI